MEKELLYNKLISNNRASFNLRWKGNFLKQKKLESFFLLFVTLLTGPIDEDSLI